MGNASKALVFAGGILISILIISVCMYMYTSFKSAYEDNMLIHESLQKDAFNSAFNIYDDTISGDTAYNIVGKVAEVNSNPAALTKIKLVGDLSVKTYKTHEFYFTESLSKNVYNYFYYDRNKDGLIDEIDIRRHS